MVSARFSVWLRHTFITILAILGTSPPATIETTTQSLCQRACALGAYTKIEKLFDG